MADRYETDDVPDSASSSSETDLDALDGVMKQTSAPQVTIDDMMEGVEFGGGDEEADEVADEETDEGTDEGTDEETDEEVVDIKEEESPVESEVNQGPRASTPPPQGKLYRSSPFHRRRFQTQGMYNRV